MGAIGKVPAGKGGKSGAAIVPPPTITVPLTLTLTEAQNLLLALVNAINQASVKGAKKGGKGKGGGGKGGK